VAVLHPLREQLVRARAQTDALFELLTPAGLLERPIAERHRLLFYLGHLEAFDWNLLCRDTLGHRSLNEAFERLFAFGIDPVDGGLPTDVPTDWPAPSVIQAWGAATRSAVDEALVEAPATGWLVGGWALRMAIEHRLMHAETLCYLLQRLEPRFKRPGPLPSVGPSPAPGAMRAIPAGVATLGLARAEAPHLGWDNEYQRHQVEVPAFRIASLPVSNAAWLTFVEAGGYQERALWDGPAWAWLQREGIAHPAFWRRRAGAWQWLAMFGEVPLPAAWPAYVSHAEASAYARWRGGRLPTEAEWHRAAEGTPTLEGRGTAGVHGNFGGLRFDPTSSGAHPAGDGVHGVSDLAGNGWEWTSTFFGPFEGFEPLPFYRGYSANFFDGRHLVLKGASAATDPALLRPSFRNWFQPHYQHAFAKFRLVSDELGSAP
jgi:ergothioneine biosynthesis protein EgtB